MTCRAVLSAMCDHPAVETRTAAAAAARHGWRDDVSIPSMTHGTDNDDQKQAGYYDCIMSCCDWSVCLCCLWSVLSGLPSSPSKERWNRALAGDRFT